MAFTLIWKNQHVVVKYDGDVTLNEVTKAQHGYEADSRFDRLKCVIIDALDVRQVLTGADDAESVLAYDIGASMTNHHMLKAFVSTHPQAIAFAQAYKATGDGFDLEIFSTLADAHAWILSKHPKLEL